MRIVSYANQTFVTTDEMAETLVRFTAQMAKSEDSEAVTVPAVDPEGHFIEVDIVVGPASEVISAPAAPGTTEIDTVAAVADLKHRTELLRVAREPTAHSLAQDTSGSSLDDFIA